MPAQRWRAEVGMPVRLSVRFEQNQVTLYDPVTITQVEIVNEAGTVIDTLIAGITRETTGIWYVDWAVPTALVPGLYYDRWTYRPYAGYDLRTGTANIVVFAAGAFSAATFLISVAYAKDKYLPPGTTLTDDDISILCALASAFIELYCQRHFVPWLETLYLDGTGRNYIFTPRNHSIRSLSSMATLDNDDVETALTVSDFRVRSNLIAHKTFRRWPASQAACFPYICVGSDASYFPAGFQNIKVVAQFGDFALIPDLIIHAAGLMVRNAGADDTITAPWIANYASERVDGQEGTFRDLVPGAKVKMGTGIPEVDAILQLYMNRKGAVVAP